MTESRPAADRVAGAKQRVRSLCCKGQFHQLGQLHPWWDSPEVLRAGNAVCTIGPQLGLGSAVWAEPRGLNCGPHHATWVFQVNMLQTHRREERASRHPGLHGEGGTTAAFRGGSFSSSLPLPLDRSLAETRHFAHPSMGQDLNAS